MGVLVSINCITYNHENYIEQAIEGFLKQKTDFEFEILIHDDASSDNTVNIIKKYQKQHPNIIKPIFQEINQHTSGVRKISYVFNHSRAEGKYIAICEGDDIWTDSLKLQKQVDYMEKNTSCSFSFHSSNIINSKDIIKGIIRPFTSSRIVSNEELIIGGGGLVPTQSIVYRKALFDNAPQLYFDAPVGDYPMQIILGSLGEVYYFDSPMSMYRKVVKGGNSWSSKNRSAQAIVNLNNKLINLLEDYDELTSKKYHNTIVRTIIKCEFHIIIQQRQFFCIFKKRNLTHFIKLSFIGKVKAIMQILFPRVYNKMINIKYR